MSEVDKLLDDHEKRQGQNKSTGQPAPAPQARTAVDDLVDSAPDTHVGLGRSIADTGVSVGASALTGVQLLANVAGADNKVSQGLGQASDYVRGFESAGRREERAARARTIEEAEQSGSTWREIGANLGAFAEAPIDTTIEAVGTSLPTLLATALTRGRGGFSVPATIGAAQGAGAVKGSIYDQVEQEYLKAGASPEEAAERAAQAQAYSSDNAGQIAIGAGLGAVAGSTGMESAVGRILGREAGETAARGVAGSAFRRAATEAQVEALQGGQERLAGNIATQNEGFDTPTWQGVAGSSVLEGVAGSAAGGGFGALEGFTGRQPTVDPLADAPADAPTAGEPSPDAPQAGPGMTPSPVPEQYRRETLGADPVQPAVDTPAPMAEPVRAPTPSEQMGIDPNTGPLSAAAAIAVDTGTSQQMAQQSALAEAAEIAQQQQKGGKSKAPEQPSLALGEQVDPATGEIVGAPTTDRATELQERIGYIQQQARVNGWDKNLVDARTAAEAELARLQPQAKAKDAARQVIATGGTEADAMRAATDSLIGDMENTPGISIAQDAPAAVAAAKQEPKAPTTMQEGIEQVRAEKAETPAVPADIKAVIAKQIPQMTDAELQQAVAHYGPGHKRTAKLNKELAKRGVQPPQQPTEIVDGEQAPQAQQAGTQRAQTPGAAAQAQPATADPAAEGVTAASQWDAMSASERETALLDAGKWTTKKGALNVIGKRIAKGTLGQMPEADRAAIEQTLAARQPQSEAAAQNTVEQTGAKRFEVVGVRPAGASDDAGARVATTRPAPADGGANEEMARSGEHAAMQGFSMHPPSIIRKKAEQEAWESGWQRGKRKRDIALEGLEDVTVGDRVARPTLNSKNSVVWRDEKSGKDYDTAAKAKAGMKQSEAALLDLDDVKPSSDRAKKKAKTYEGFYTKVRNWDSHQWEYRASKYEVDRDTGKQVGSASKKSFKSEKEALEFLSDVPESSLKAFTGGAVVDGNKETSLNYEKDGAHIVRQDDDGSIHFKRNRNDSREPIVFASKDKFEEYAKKNFVDWFDVRDKVLSALSDKENIGGLSWSELTEKANALGVFKVGMNRSEVELAVKQEQPETAGDADSLIAEVGRLASMEKRAVADYMKRHGVEALEAVRDSGLSQRQMFSLLGDGLRPHPEFLALYKSDKRIGIYYKAEAEHIKGLSTDAYSALVADTREAHEFTPAMSYAVLRHSDQKAEIEYIGKLGRMANRFRIGSQEVGGKLNKMARPYVDMVRQEKNQQQAAPEPKPVTVTRTEGVTTMVIDPSAGVKEKPDPVKEKAKESEVEGKDAERFAANKLFTADKVAAARARMKSKLGQLNSGIDPELLVDGMTLAGAYIESGIRKFSDYAKAMTDDFGDSIKPYLLSFWEGARNYPGLDTEGMTSAEASKAEFDALVNTEQAAEIAPEAVGEVAEKPKKRARKTGSKGDMTLTQDWGVSHIDGYGDANRETGNDTKDAFLREARSYLNSVADALRSHGFEPHPDRKGKPGKPVNVNESSMAGSGDVTLTMHNPDTDQNAYIHIGDTSLLGVVPATDSGIAIMYRVGTGADRYGTKAVNTWAPVTLSANELAGLVAGSAKPTEVATNEQLADGDADQGGAPEVRGRGSLAQQGTAQTDPGNVAARQPADGGAADSVEGAGRPGVRQPGTDVAPGEGAAQGRAAGDGRARAGGARVSDAGAGAAGADGAADAAGSRSRDTAPVTSPAATRVQAQDLHIDNPLEIVGGTPVQRFNRNRAALELLQTLEEEGRQATPEEQRVLAGYIGWGSFGQELFQGTWDRPVYKDEGIWKERGEWLRETLGESAWKSAQRSITNAHYTDPPTVMAMWDMARRMGFTGGKVLEPSMGTGNFFSMMPADIKARSQLTGIELDETTGAIAKHLFPKSNIRVMGYEQSKTPDNFYDLAIGNWPFENTPIADRRYNKLNPMLHDYFFLKTLDQVRPGGLVIGITSAGSMDKQNTMIRREMARKAELVASIRLPSGAFEEYAGTKVVTDIVVLRKRPERLVAVPADATWVETGEFQTPSGEKVRVNQHYLSNPQSIIGQLDFGHGTTTFRAGMIVHRPDNMAERLRQAVDLVPENAMQPAGQADHLTYYANETGERHGALSLANDRLMVAMGDQMVLANDKAKYELKDAKKTAAREQQLRDAVELRRLHTTLVDAERRGEDAKAARRALKAGYERFVADHGPLRESFALAYLERIEDPFFAELAALENDDGTPSAVMTRSTTRSKRQIDNPNIRDAYVLARNQSIIPSLDDIARIANKSADEVRAELLGSGAVFESPAGDIVPSDIYLSGNVREKMREAVAALEEGNAAMQANIDALQEVMPEDVPYFNIETKLGATWVPSETYAGYIEHMLGRSDTKGIDVSFRAGRWKVKLDHALNAAAEASANYGTPHYSFSRLAQAAMSNQVLRLRSKDSDGNEYYDAEKSEEVNSRLAKMREDFGTWLWSDPERRVEMEREYNESRNAWATPRYDGSFLTFEGMALSLGKGDFDLREHQANAIWRAIVNRRSLNAHEVGTGKTFTMGGIAIESRRYGIARKPVILAHNANSATVAKEIRMMYPSARVLYVDNLEPKNRDIRLRQIANDDWDAIVIPHSLIDRLALREETLMQMAADDIAALEAEFFDAAAEDGESVDNIDLDDDEAIAKIHSVTAKELAKARKRIIESIKKQAQQASKEGAVTFEDLGIDMVLVDEVHEFKKPPIVTRMQMKGLNTQVSGRSIALQLLTRYVRQMNNGGNVHTFTGTPITNTITEIYHQMRYVMESEMEQANVADWDGWFGSFATEVQDVELSAAGDYEMVTRLAGFVNVPELRQMVGQYMDTVFAEDMPEMQPRKTKNGKQLSDEGLTEAERAELLNGRTEGAQDRPYKKVVNATADMTAQQQRVFSQLQGYAQDWRNASGKERRELMRTGDPRSPIVTEGIANKASFDVRLLDETLAGMEGKTNDDPNSKASRVVANTLEIYNSHPQAGQVIFAEMGFSKSVRRTRSDGEGGKTSETVKVFSTVHDIVERLVQGGIPREQIAIVDGKVNKEKRREIAEAMNDGRIRVVIGSTDTLGVGVNMQRNLRAMHHMDAPYMPGELEQRNGRGQRQGNQWNTVMEYRYMTDRLDGRRWQILAVKQRFITAFMKADAKAARVIEGEAAADEQSDILESFSEAAGDPRVLQRVKIQKKMESLQRKERMYTQGIADMRRQIRYSENQVADITKQIDRIDVEAVTGLIQAQRGQFTATIDGVTYDARKDAVAALEDYLTENMRMGEKKRHIGTYGGSPLLVEWLGISDTPTTTVEVGGEEFSGKGIAGVEASMRNLPKRVEAMHQDRDAAKATAENMRTAMQQPFGQAADLERATKQLADLEQDLEMNPVPPPAWLRQGAPIDSEVYRNKKPYIVTGHRYSQDGWFVVAEDDKGTTMIPYMQATDNVGMPVYDEREFVAPVVMTKDNAQELTDADKVPESDTPKFSRSNRQINSVPFKRWFGDSKVVDAEGKPLVVYHGSPDVRGIIEGGFAQSPVRGSVFFFTDSVAVADTYADDRRAFDYQNAEPHVLPVYLSMQNPYVVDAKGARWRETERHIKEARDGGHDGIIIRNSRDEYNNLRDGGQLSTVYAVFEPTQVKSAATGNLRSRVDGIDLGDISNRGTYDPDNPHFLFSRSSGDSAGRRGRKPLPEAQLRRTVEAFFRHYRGADNVGIEYHATAQTLPGYRAGRDEGAVIGGQYEWQTDTVHLVVSAFDSQSKVREALQEEVLVHKGLGFFRPEDRQQLYRDIQQAAQESPEVAALWDRTVLEYQDVAESAKLSDEQANRLYAEELLGTLAQRRINWLQRGWRTLRKGIKRLLVKAGWVNDRIGLDELRGRIDLIARAFERGQRTPRRNFSRDVRGVASGSMADSAGNVGAYGQRPVTADEAARLGMTQDEANDAQGSGDILFSRSGGATRSGIKQFAAKATDELNKTFNAPGKLSKWHTTVGTMNNLAQRSPYFKPVFESAQGFIDDVAYYAADAAELAGKLLPKLETWRDIAKKPISAKDNQAIEKPINEGTLVWARDANGKPVRVESLMERAQGMSTEDKARELMDRGMLEPGMNAAWKGQGKDRYAKLIDSRYESQMLKAGIVWTPAELKSQFGLTGEAQADGSWSGQIGLYQEFRAAIDRSLDTMGRADMLRFGGKDLKPLREQVMDAPDIQAASRIIVNELKEMAADNPDRETQLMQIAHGIVERAEKVAELQKEGYAPLSRFGKHTVDVVVDGERQYFSLFETAREANAMAEQMRAEFGADNVSQGTLSNESYKLFAGITPESLELFGNMLGLDSDGDSARDQAFQEYLRMTKTNRSAMRRLIHRKGIAGFSTDVGRVLANFVYSNARQTAAGLNMGDLGDAITAIPKAQGELTDVAVRLAEYIKNPQEEAQAVRGLLFAQYLGGSVASAFVNITQPFAVTFPWLSQYGGAKKAAAELTKAARDMSTKGKKYEAGLAAALKAAEDDGTVSPQEVHQLMAQARGSGSLAAGDGTRLGEARAAANNSVARLSLAWGKMFGAAEQANRRVTFIAAYRVAKDQGMADPAEFAREAVRETQFIYSKANKMQWGRGAVGGTLMTFKTYSVAYIELMHRLWNQGEKGSPERKEGRKAAMLMVATLMLMGGAGGLPFAEDLDDVIDGAAQLMGYNFSARKAKEQFLIDVFGDALADFIDKGVSGLPGAPLDVSGRLGLGNLIPGTGLFTERSSHSRDLLEIAGPAGDFASRILTGTKKALGGDVIEGVTEVMPTAVRNAIKGADMAATGMYRDTKGYKVLETTHLEAAMKAMGFQPASVAKVQEANWLSQRAKNFYNMQAQEIRATWAAGIFEKNPAKVQRARDAVAEWNRKNPNQPMIIRIPDVMRRVREMSKTKDERIAATAPRAMRAQMREDLARVREGL